MAGGSLWVPGTGTVGMDELCPTLLWLPFAAWSKSVPVLSQEKRRENKIEAPGEMLSPARTGGAEPPSAAAPDTGAAHPPSAVSAQ